MRSGRDSPPQVIDSARILCFAIIDDDVIFTERIHLMVDGERLGKVLRLAIGRNYRQPEDILLLFCDANWESLGVSAFDSVEAAKSRAEAGYRGTADKWFDVDYSIKEIDRFLREEYQVDPTGEWRSVRCSFCGSADIKATGMFTKNDASICYECVKDFYKHFAKEK